MKADLITIAEAEAQESLDLLQTMLDRESHWLFVSQAGSLGELAWKVIAEKVPKKHVVMVFQFRKGPPLPFHVVAIPRYWVSPSDLFALIGSKPLCSTSIISLSFLPAEIYKWFTARVWSPTLVFWN